MGECHYLEGNYTAQKRIKFLKPLLNFIGIDQERLNAKWISSAQAPEFVNEIKTFIDKLRSMGPSPLKPYSGRDCSDTTIQKPIVKSI